MISQTGEYCHNGLLKQTLKNVYNGHEIIHKVWVNMRIHLFVADTDADHIERVARSVARCPDISLIGTGSNGSHVLRQLSVTPADILITEVQLPGLDGIMLIRDLQKQHNGPAAIVCTGFYSQACVARARACGAAYYMYKPLDYNRLPEVIRECHRARLEDAAQASQGQSGATEPGLKQAMRALLRECGMPARLTGTAYLSMALEAASADPALVKNLSKGLYPVVAERMRTTPACLERALRNAIYAACERGGLDARFGHCPTNREFILYLLDQLALRCPR